MTKQKTIAKNYLNELAAAVPGNPTASQLRKKIKATRRAAPAIGAQNPVAVLVAYLDAVTPSVDGDEKTQLQGFRDALANFAPEKFVEILEYLDRCDGLDSSRYHPQPGTNGFEVPEVFKGLTADDADKYEFICNLFRDESRGIIIDRTASFDDHLLKLLLVAYCHKAGAAAGYKENKVEKMTFDDKINILAGLPLIGKEKDLRDQAVAKLHPMRRVRNKAAHKASFTPAEVEKLYGDEANRRLMENFPGHFEAECAAVQGWLQELLVSPTFDGAH